MISDRWLKYAWEKIIVRAIFLLTSFKTWICFYLRFFIKNRIIGVILIEPWGIERCSGFFTWNTLPWLHEKSLKLLFLTKVNLCFPYSKFNKGHKIIISVPKFISDRIENFFISKDFKFAEFIKYFADLNSKKVNFNVFMLTHQQN